MSVIEARELCYVYHPGTAYEKQAVKGINLSVEKGEFLSIVGANGSGKSTLIQHFNGLLLPSSGQLSILGESIYVKAHRERLWQKVGLVFQFPEQQLFEGTVYDEVAYGLKNMGLDKWEIDRRVKKALAGVGLELDKVGGCSPFSLSGGTMRRIAIASVMAMEPEILVLDEPSAGLDPEGSTYIFQSIKRFQQDQGVTVIMVSHCLNELILLSDRMVLLEQGEIRDWGTVRGVLTRQDGGNLILPEYIRLLIELKQRGWDIDSGVLTVEEAAQEIAGKLSSE